MNDMNKISNPVDTDDALNDTWEVFSNNTWDDLSNNADEVEERQEHLQEVEDSRGNSSEAERRSAEISAAQAELQKAKEYLEQKPELKSKMVNALSELEQIESVLSDSSASDEEKQNKIKESEQFINSVKTFNKAAETNTEATKRYEDLKAEYWRKDKEGKASDDEMEELDKMVKDTEALRDDNSFANKLDMEVVERQLEAEKDAAVKDALDSFNEDIGLAHQNLAKARARKAQLEVEYSEKEKSGKTTAEELKGIDDQIHELEDSINGLKDDAKRLTQRYKDSLSKIDKEFAEKSKNLKGDTEKGGSEKSNEMNGESGEKSDSEKKDGETSKDEKKDSEKSESDDVEEKLQKERADDVNKILNEKGEKKEEQKETTFNEFFKNRWDDEKKREEYLPRLEHETDQDYEYRFKERCYTDFDEMIGHKSNFDKYDDEVEFGPGDDGEAKDKNKVEDGSDDEVEFGPGEDGEEDNAGGEKEKKRNIFGRLKDFFASKFGRSKEGAKNALFTPAEEQERRRKNRLGRFIITALAALSIGGMFGSFRGNSRNNMSANKAKIETESNGDSTTEMSVDDILNEASKQSLNVDLNKEVGAETVDDNVEGTTYGEKVDFNIDAGEWDGNSSYFSSEKHGVNDLTAPIYNMESTGSKAEISKDMVEGFANNLDDPIQQAEFAALGGTDVKIGNANGISSLEDMNDVFNMAQSDDEFRQELANYSKDQLRDLIEQNDVQHSTVEKGTVYSSLYALNTAGDGEQARLKYFVDDEVTAKEDFEVLQFINDDGNNALNTNEIGGYKYNFLKSVGIIPENASDEKATDIMNHKTILGISGKCGQIIWLDTTTNTPVVPTPERTTPDKPTPDDNENPPDKEKTNNPDEPEEEKKDTPDDNTPTGGGGNNGNTPTGGGGNNGNTPTGGGGNNGNTPTGGGEDNPNTPSGGGDNTPGDDNGLAPKTNVFPGDIGNTGVNNINSGTPVENKENNNGIGDSVAGEENGQGNSGIAGVETGSQNEKDVFSQTRGENGSDSTRSGDSSGHNQGNTASTESSSETQDVSTKTEDISNPDSNPNQNQTNMDDAENEAANRLG